MKKYFKLLAKKSFSLFMAVIMLMTCWVWMAPTEAEAIDQHSGGYYIEVYGFLQDWTTQSDVTNAWTAYDTAGNATSLTCYPVITNAQYTGALAYGWVNSFPSYVKNTNNVPKVSGSCGTTSNGDSYRYENLGVRIRVYNADGSYDWKWLREQSTDSNYTVETSFEHTIDWDETSADFKPYAASVRSSVATQKLSISVPEFNAGTNGSVSFTAPGVYDQYGTKISSVTGYNLYSDNAAATTAYAKEAGVWVSNTTVYASELAQKGIPNASGSQKVYLFGEYNELKGLVAEITLNYPDYTVKVDPDGSITGLGATMDMSDNSTQTGAWTATGPYSSTAAKYPSGTASKTGYTFKGFWSVKQPTTGDAGINADEATFATPVSSEEFVTVYGGTAGAEYVEKDGKKYFNAGTKWDSTHKEIQGNDTFYGWWIPQDIVVKFYDIDGTYLGTKKAKYGSTQAADWYLNPKDGYNAGAFEYKSFAGKWRDITGIEVVEGSYKFGALSTLTLTPIYTTKTYNDKYDINFIDPSNGSNLTAYSKEYTYRDVLADTQIPKGLATFGTLANDPGYTYEFSGWTSLKPASGNYHTLAVGDTTITENTDWVVREDITYYAVYRSTVKEYLVAFNYIDSTGANKTETLTVPYGSAIATPSVVNRTYATGGYGYTLAGWTYKNGTNASVTLDADGTIVFNNTNVFVTTNNIAPNGAAIVFTAAYGEGQSTPYTITFKYKDAKGNDKTITGEVYHGYKITQELVDELAIVPGKYDDGTSEYLFSNLWKVTEGTAGKAEYTKDEFTSFSPVSHVTFEALYGEGTPFYTVKYIDGTNTYSERVLAGSNIPAWMVGEGEDAKEYEPTKADSETGEYTFAGWFDAAQTDKDYAVTNGNKYTLEEKVNADITLYSQYIFSPFTYTVKFVDYDGTVLAEGKYEADASFEDIVDVAEEKASKPADEIYSYNFIGWDKALGSYTCVGADMTFTAQYRPSYITYKARWYNDEASMKNADPDEMVSIGEAGLLAITSHTYNAKIYAPSVALTAPAGKVFDSWKYIGKDGKEATYTRGMLITDGMSFYATYKDAPVTYTLTTIVNGDKTEYELGAGSTAEVAGTPVDGYVNADKHKKFIGWYTDDDKKFELTTEITADITITAKFEVKDHDKSLKELVEVPTYYTPGSEKIWCACSREDTEETVEIAMLTDTVAPTGTIYLGDKYWSSKDEIGAAATDDQTPSIYVNDDTDIILTINDTGDVNAYNTSGVGKGIAVIQGIIAKDVFGADTTEIAGIQKIYEDNTEELNNTANYVIRLGSYKGLEDGKTYIAYYYVKDKAGNVLNKNVRTAKFIYDITAPEIYDRADPDADINGMAFCEEVIFAVDDAETVKVNGKEVILENGEYKISGKGSYLITATDRAGNTSTKKIFVADGHDIVVSSKAVTCTEDGYVKEFCAACGETISEVTIESAGNHAYSEVVVEPTCTEDGYKVEKCSVCGYEQNKEVLLKLNHVGTDTYTEVTKTPTCSVKGVETTYCKACKAVIATEEIDFDTVNGHTFGATKVLKPTCTKSGKKYQQCKYCYVQQTIETIDPLNHVDTGRYTAITTEATCNSKGVETTYCKVCDAPMGTKEIDTIPHILKLVEYTADTDKSDAFPNGYKQYECQATGCTHTEGKVAIEVIVENYTVIFAGMGEGGADLVITKKAGETITEDDVLAKDEEGKPIYPTKASDNEKVYKFAGWKGTNGKIAKLPVKVTKNETYTVEFTASTRIYTHTFKINENDEDAFATVIGTYEATNKKPIAKPTKKATETETYSFEGWLKIGDNSGEVVTDFTMTEDAEFYAKFTTESVEFNVIFYNEDGSYIWSTKGNDKNKVSYNNVDDNDNLIAPVKAPDADGHYTFAGWKYGEETIALGGEFGPITELTRLYATYNVADHEFEEVAEKTTAATCTEAGQKTEKCSVCGYEKVSVIEALGHSYVDQADGSQVCSNCGDKVEPEVKKFTVATKEVITYYNADGTVGTAETDSKLIIKAKEDNETYVEGAKYTLTADKKADTAKYTVKFVGWKDGNSNDVADGTEFTATANATYTAYYTATVRTYTVRYATIDREVIEGEEYTVTYGEVLPEFQGTIPVKKATEDDHFVFVSWNVSEGTIVKADQYIQPVYKAVGHTWDEGKSVNATCTENAGIKYTCTVCGYSKPLGSGAAKGHDMVTVIKPATYTEEGYKKSTCSVCGEEETEIYAKLAYKTVKVTVTKDGALVEGATVAIYKDGKELDKNQTMYEGYVVLGAGKNLEHGSYSVLVVKDGVSNTFALTVKDTDAEVICNADITVESDDNGGSEEPKCSCSCHRNGFWGILYRFFQKVISWITGRINCCSCPDGRY